MIYISKDYIINYFNSNKIIQKVFNSSENKILNTLQELIDLYEKTRFKFKIDVNASCGKCDTPLVNDHLVLDDGSSVQISKCPSCLGKIKSPLCCGEDMVCEV